MAVPTINDLELPIRCVLVEPDGGADSTTGVIFRRSRMGGAMLKTSPDGQPTSEGISNHVLFAIDMSTPVEIDGTKYRAMHEEAIVGIIPD